MPEVLVFKDLPDNFQKFHIEPFFEEYIPGARIICCEGNNGKKVFFQIPSQIFEKINKGKMAELVGNIHEWWQTKGIYDENFIAISRIS